MMNPAVANIPPSSEQVTLQILSDGLDAQSSDLFLDHLLEIAEAHGYVTCTLSGATTLQIKSNDNVLEATEMPRAKSTLRMLCARLSVRFGENANRKSSAYGDAFEIVSPRTQRPCRISFQNTTTNQEIVIELKEQTPAV